MVVSASNISPLHQGTAKRDQAFLAIVSKIKAGNSSSEEIQQALSGDWLATALGLYEGLQEQGLVGFEKVYQTLKHDNKLLQKWEAKVFDRPVYAGTLLSDVKSEKPEWLWKPRLALGKIAALDGDPGIGKSILTLDLIARITRGLPMPDGTPCTKGGAVIITPEDGLADTIRPRLERAGADLTIVSSLSTVKDVTEEGLEYQRGFTLNTGDLRLLEMEIERVKAKIVVIDPIMAVMGGKDTYKDNEVRAALAPLQMIIETHHVACVMVRHLTKGRSDNPLMAGGGSIAFIGVARTGLFVAKDPFNDCVVLAHHKSNIGKLGESLTYTIASDEEQGDDRPYVVWEGVSTANISDLINPTSPSKNTGGNRQQILDFLEEKKPAEVTIQDITEAVPDMSMTNLKVTLKRMYDKGEIGKSERGQYHAK